MESSFADQQANAARLKKEMLERAQSNESAQAIEFLRRFVAEAKAKGLEPEPLQVKGYGGKQTAKTDLLGWYLKADRTLAVDTDANFYILIKDLSFLDRFRPVHPVPSPPPLILGKGGRDGESMDLSVKLTELLPSWRQGGVSE